MKKISLFMLMAVGLLISGNLRADNVCKIVGGDEYETLQAAFDAVSDNVETEITLINNVEQTLESGCYATLNANKNVILNLNGKQINIVASVQKASTHVLSVEYNATLTINDSSEEKIGQLSIFNSAHVKGQGYVGGNHNSVIKVKGNLIVNDGVLLNKAVAKGYQYVIDYQTPSISNTNTSVTINGGKILGVSEDGERWAGPIRVYPNYGSQNKISLAIHGGEIEGRTCIYLQNDNVNGSSETTIDGGVISGDLSIIYSDGAHSKNATVYIQKAADGSQPIMTGDLESMGVETYHISAGIFNTSNVFRTSESTVVLNNFVNTLKGGIYYYEAGATQEYLQRVVQFAEDGGTDYAVTEDGFSKYYAPLNNREGWEELGFEVRKVETPTGRTGDWYGLYRYLESDANFTLFKTFIAEGYMAVDITGQSDGNGGTYPDKTVIVKQVENVVFDEDGIWTPDKTDETKAVIIDAGANITIPAGTTVEAYSVNVPTGTTLNVEKGATLIVGAGGVTTATGTEPISINIGSNDGSGAIKISPDAPADKAQPRVRIKLTTIAHKDAQGNSHWQYFARPTVIHPESFTVVVPQNATEHYIRGYNGSTDSYIDITEPSQFENYEGYAITNNSTQGGVIYQFEGTLNANKNAEIKFKNKGFSLMGNSYLAPVSVEGLFKGIIEGATVAPATAPIAYKAPMEDGGNAVEWTIWIYNCANERFEQTNLLQAMAKKKQLQPMQGFFMKLREGTSLDAAIDYVGAVWNNNAQVGPILAPAYNENEMAAASIVVSANGNADQIDLFEGAEFDNTFNNGADASKLMNLQGMFNLYAQTEAGTLSCVASDNIEGTILTFQANNASEYELSFNGVENMNYSLIDLFNGEIIEMNESNVYKFNAVPNSTEARFQIVEGYKAPTAMEKVNNVKAVKGIYSVTGAYIGEVKNFNALPAGIYIVNGQQIVK